MINVTKHTTLETRTLFFFFLPHFICLLWHSFTVLGIVKTRIFLLLYVNHLIAQRPIRAVGNSTEL